MAHATREPLQRRNAHLDAFENDAQRQPFGHVTTSAARCNCGKDIACLILTARCATKARAH
eukprot:1665997-Lingulodinium_polyedra.AAC.1